jgi:hypothetical protein
MEQHTVRNMVQGVSQQAPQTRRDTQCEAQFDMLNQAVQGATARPGFEVDKKVDGDDNEGAFFYNIIRDNDERYTVTIKDGVLRVINFLTGDLCTVTELEDVSAYLKPLADMDDAPDGALDRDYWCATTGEDETFIASKLIKPAMGDIKSPDRPPEALFWFRAGGYMVTYQISVKYDGTWYNWAYQTPDNSVAGNAEYITTDQICYALYNAMLTDPTNPITGLGFSIARQGNIMRLWRDDDEDFDIETIDGQSNNMLSGIKGSVSGLEFLPKNGFDGMSFKVDGAADADADDWYVCFTSDALDADSTTQGAWIETVRKDTVVNIAFDTMPLYLFNIAPNEFELSFAAWGDRVSGDGVEAAKDPSFIGKYIESITYDRRRLNIMSKASTVWGRTNNALVFFPDTARAGLATAPIDTVPKLTNGIAILRYLVQTNGVSYLFADGKQISVQHGNNSVFSNSSIDMNLASEFEWNTKIRPVGVGTSLLFSTALGEYSSFTDVTFEQGFPTNDEDISEHVPEYVPADLLQMIASFTAKKLFAIAASTPNRLYCYEYRITRDNGRVQSAWNTWRLPLNCTILHAILDKAKLVLFVKRPEGTFLMHLSVAPRQKDPEGSYLTRLDMRVTDEQCTVEFEETSGNTLVTLPYAATDDLDFTQRDGYKSLMLVVRQNAGDFKRGSNLTLLDVEHGASTTTLTLSGNLTDVPFYAGFRIRSERTESVFYSRNDESGYVYLQRLQVMRAILAFSNTGYTRCEVTNPKKGVARRVQEFEGRTLGDIRNVFDEVVLSSGDFDVGVGEANTEAVVTWINDSFLPSSWQSMTWWFNPTQRP